MESLLPFEQALLAAANFKDTATEVTFANARLDHTYRIVQALRRIASDLIDLDGDMREYYQALLIHTLNTIRLRHISVEKKEHALLAASLICQRLEDWPEWEIPPTVAPGRPAALSPHLSEHARPTATKHGAVENAKEGQRQMVIRLASAGAFFVVGTVVVVSLWWAMQHFNPGLQAQAMTLLYLSVFAVIVFALLGIIAGPTAVRALQKLVGMVPSLLGDSDHTRTGKPNGDEKEGNK